MSISATSKFSTAATTTGFDRKRLARVRMTVIGAQTIEWYDFFVYTTAAALVFPTVFFSSSFSPAAATLSSFATVTVGFVARPIGSVIFGHIGDRHGRRPALLLALTVMAVGCLSIALLPGFSAIGMAAPIALTLCRILQGLAIGGQWGGGVLLATENAPAHRKGLYGSLAQIGLPLGLILASAAFLVLLAILDNESFTAIGWRIPFAVGAILIILPIIGQLRLRETAEYMRSKKVEPAKGPSPVLQVIRHHPGRIAVTAGMFIVVGATFYILTTGMLAYGTQTLGFTRNMMLACVLIGAAAMTLSIVVASHISDLVGRKPVFLTGAGLTALWAFPMFSLINSGSLLSAGVAIGVGMLFNGIMYGPSAVLFCESFPVEIRYSGVSLGYQLSSLLGAGFAPLIMTSLIAATGGTAGVSLYIIGLAVITIASVCLLRVPRRQPVREGGAVR
jgi:MFS family permease